MTAATSHFGHRVHTTNLRVPVSRVCQSVVHRVPVVLLCLRATVVQRDRRLRHTYGGSPLKPRHRVRHAIDKP